MSASPSLKLVKILLGSASSAGFKRTDRVLRSVAQNLEDLGHLPSRSQVHPEAGHGAPRGQADYTAAVIEEECRKDQAWADCRPAIF